MADAAGTGIFDVAHGGLSIFGAVAGGLLALVVYANLRGWPIATFLDCAVVGLPLAQACGRWGNYFNQELFGKPTTLPWALQIDPVNRPAGYESYATFHPVFLYESIACIVIALVLVWADHRFKMGHGRVFALYVALYCLFRGPIENLRIDEAHHILGVRLNVFTSLVVGLIALGYFVRSSERYRGREFMRDGQILAGRRRAEIPTEGTGGKRKVDASDKPIKAEKAPRPEKPVKAKRRSDKPEDVPASAQERAEVAAAVSADVSRLLEEIQAARAKGTQVGTGAARPVVAPPAATPPVTPAPAVAPPAAAPPAARPPVVPPAAAPPAARPPVAPAPAPSGDAPKERGRRLKGK